MKTFPIIDDDTGMQSGFEIENAYILPNTVSRLLGNVDGVTNIHLRGGFFSDTDIRVEFTYLGKKYTVLEPFGDNSRYFISPDNVSESSAEVKTIEDVFKGYEPPMWRRIIGDLLTLKCIKFRP